VEIDLFLKHGTVIPMDPERRIIEDGAVAVDKGHIVGVGYTSDLEVLYQGNREINCTNHVIMPGLIDAHGHAGHSLFKCLLLERPSEWMKYMTYTYHNRVTDDFWYIEGRLSALERLKSGITTGVSVLGSVPRSDTPVPGCNHARAYAEVGIREIVCPGPANPPWPHEFSRFIDGQWVTSAVPYEKALEGMEGVIQTWNHGANDRIRVYVAPFVLVTSVNPSYPTPPDLAIELTEHDRFQMRKMREIAAKYNTRIHTDAFGGMIQMCHKDEFALLGPDVHLQHCRGISFNEAVILAETGTHVSSSPGIGSIQTRCPVPELINMGVPVACATDGTSPSAPFDLFQTARKMRMVHQFWSHDGYYLPTGKLLEMITIDAAKVIGWEDSLGSLEEGKKADIITVNLHTPHSTPAYLPIHRLVHQVLGSDVDTVIVDGQIILQDRKVMTIDEEDILKEAEGEATRTLEQAGLEKFLKLPSNFWGSNRVILTEN
jgi:5-methylthioadenosine/S-adenosylhomocysteine deaminase